ECGHGERAPCLDPVSSRPGVVSIQSRLDPSVPRRGSGGSHPIGRIPALNSADSMPGVTAPIIPGAEPFSQAGGPSGVLVLHGFTGNPSSMRPIADLAAAKGFTVELPRLPGHGTSVEDIMTTTWSDWAQTAEAAYDDLASRCERAAIVGLSMGGALTAYVAELRDSIAGCVFINPIVKPPPVEMIEGLEALLA